MSNLSDYLLKRYPAGIMSIKAYEFETHCNSRQSVNLYTIEDVADIIESEYSNDD